MRFLLLFTLVCAGLMVGDITLAQDQVYKPLVDLPQLDANAQSTEQYVNALYLLSITVAALLAFVKILYGGIKWMFSDVVTSKESAKKDIRGALFGLLIVISAVLILETINTDLTTLNIFGDAPSISEVRSQPVPEEEELPLVDAEIGDSLNTGVAGEEEIEHFTETCDGVINSVVDGTTRNIILSCDEEVDLVNSLPFTCSGNTCICNPGNEGTSVCVSRCSVEGPAGATYTNWQSQADGTVLCNYIVERTPEQCQTTPYGFCTTAAVGGMACEESQNPSRICRTSDNGGSTSFYGFIE